MKFGGQEMLLLFLIVLLLFGAARLPKLARSLREAKDEFQKETGPSDVAEAHTATPEPAAATAPASGSAAEADGPKPAGLQTEPENKQDTPNA
jgi:sec-independent protein translocase protein TatA